MELESIQAGILSIIPPLIAISPALITKEVILSLVLGILSGTLIYSLSTGRPKSDFGPMAKTTTLPLSLALLHALLILIPKFSKSAAKA